MRISDSNLASLASTISSSNTLPDTASKSTPVTAPSMAEPTDESVDMALKAMSNPASEELVDRPVIILKSKGDDASQDVGPKAPSTPGSGTVSGSGLLVGQSTCQDGVLANGFSALWSVGGNSLGGDNTPNTAGEGLAGAVGKEMGTATCVLLTTAANLFNTGPDKILDPTAPSGDGGVCKDQGPTGGQSAGPGGICKDPNPGGFTPAGSYVDPATGELITNQNGTTTAGDANADQGVYAGEVDDPNFVNNQCAPDQSLGVGGPDPGQPSPGGNMPADDDSGVGTPRSSSFMPADDDNGVGTPRSDGFMPADDSVGGGTPRSDSFMPADDSVGGGTPRSEVLNLNDSGMPADDSTGGGTPRSDVAEIARQNATLNAAEKLLSRGQLR